MPKKNEQPDEFSIYEFFQKFPNEEAARLHFEKQRWSQGVECPHCASKNVYECKDHKPMPYRCRECREHFSVRTGTILAESRLELQKWLMAMYLLTSSRKGISSIQLAKHLGCTQKTAWFLAHRIREAWQQNKDKLNKEIEVDETFIGGKEANKHAHKKLKAGRGAVGKAPVMGLLERGGDVKMFAINGTDKETLTGQIRDNVEAGSTVYTDTFTAYTGLNEYTHKTVNHSAKEFVNGMAHTNGIESVWALLKRGYYGIYHHMSTKHLQRYINEFGYRYNTASKLIVDCIDQTIVKGTGNRLTYARLTHG